MPYLQRDNAKIYYEETGSGDPVIAVHGLIENTTYWRVSGIVERLAPKHRFIAMDDLVGQQPDIVGFSP